MRRRSLPRAGLLVAVLAPLLASGCALGHLHDLQFRVDKRLSFTGPPARSVVHQPVTISWTMKDFTVQPPGSGPPSRGAGYFAVFVDRSPIRPGHSMDDIAKGDEYCQRSPTCPDRSYLRDHQVYTTTATSIRFPLIPSIVGDKSHLQMHTFTVVLMDTSGRRIGESAWELDLRMPRLGVS